MHWLKDWIHIEGLVQATGFWIAFYAFYKTRKRGYILIALYFASAFCMLVSSEIVHSGEDETEFKAEIASAREEDPYRGKEKTGTRLFSRKITVLAQIILVIGIWMVMRGEEALDYYKRRIAEILHGKTCGGRDEWWDRELRLAGKIKYSGSKDCWLKAMETLTREARTEELFFHYAGVWGVLATEGIASLPALEMLRLKLFEIREKSVPESNKYLEEVVRHLILNIKFIEEALAKEQNKGG